MFDPVNMTLRLVSEAKGRGETGKRGERGEGGRAREKRRSFPAFFLLEFLS